MLYINIKYDEEKWVDLVYKKIKKNMYEISTYGRIKNKHTGKILSQCPSEKGYMMVNLMTDAKRNNKTYKVHRLVAYTFLYEDNWDELTVNHINGDKTDNSIYNLELITFSENIKHSYATGLNIARKGELNGMCKITEEIANDICVCISNNIKPMKTQKLIFDKYGIEISKDMYYDIKRKRTWRHVSRYYF